MYGREACLQLLFVFLFNGGIFVTVLMVQKCSDLSTSGSAYLLGGYFLFQTIVALSLTCADKCKATEGGPRVAVVTLICSCFFCGSFGVALGMLVCWHKVRNCPFILNVLLTLPINAAWIMLGVLVGVPREKVCSFQPRTNATIGG